MWLEAPNGPRIPINGNCALGRSSSNTVVLSGTKVSRQHAIIHVQNGGQFWLVDLGSVNGTYVNDRRVQLPVQLSDRDMIVLGDETLTFRRSVTDVHDAYQTRSAQQTVRDLRYLPCWFLIGDIENFTPLSESLGAEKLAVLVGGWVSSCKEIIEQHGGTINKYLGDGFLAYWRDTDATSGLLVDCLAALKKFRAGYDLRFRIVIHYGLVTIGGVSSTGEESLIGREANFAFRLEKLAGKLGALDLASEPAANKLGDALLFRALGNHKLKGFEGKHAVFSF